MAAGFAVGLVAIIRHLLYQFNPGGKYKKENYLSGQLAIYAIFVTIFLTVGAIEKLF